MREREGERVKREGRGEREIERERESNIEDMSLGVRFQRDLG